MSLLQKSFGKFIYIHYVRAFASLLVLFYHLESGLSNYWVPSNPVRLFKDCGSLGVSIFFFLRGFLIPYTSLRRVRTFSQFLILKICRIYPTYLFVTFLVLGFILFLPENIFNSNQIFDFEKLIKTLLFFPNSNEIYVFVGWTLSFQWVFYILFAFFSFRFKKIIKKPIFPLIISSCLLILYLMDTSYSNFFSFFVIGTGVFYLVTFREINGELNKKYLYILITTLLTSIFFNLTGFLIGFIVFLIVYIEKRKPQDLEPNLLLTIGNASYSIYLIQVITYPASLKVSLAIVKSQPFLMPSYLVFYLLSLSEGF